MTHIGCPVIGDPVYLRSSAPIWARKTTRMFLHAEQLTLAHPYAGRPLTVSAPLPPAFEQMRTKLAKLKPEEPQETAPEAPYRARGSKCLASSGAPHRRVHSTRTRIQRTQSSERFKPTCSMINIRSTRWSHAPRRSCKPEAERTVVGLRRPEHLRSE